MSHQGGMATKMVNFYTANDNKLLLNSCKLEMKIQKPLHVVSIHT